MGQKVNPISARLSLTKKWDSRWYTSKKLFAAYLKQDEQIRNSLHKKYHEGAIKDIIIFRDNKVIEITIHTAKPGIVIGRSGKGMNDIKELVQKTCFLDIPIKKQPKIRIHVEEVRKVEESAKLTAENVAFQIEKRVTPRKAMRQALEKLKDKGILGAKVRVSGRLGGAEIARSESLSFGPIPLHTLRMKIDYACVHAQTTYGTVGVKIWINLAEYKPDEEEQKDDVESERRRER